MRLGIINEATIVNALECFTGLDTCTAFPPSRTVYKKEVCGSLT